MPLRDHFQPPVSKAASWEGFHGMWPGVIVQQLFQTLPPGYVAEPRVRLGAVAEIDVGALEQNSVPKTSALSHRDDSDGGVATAVVAPPQPTLEVEMELPEQYEYEVLVFDATHERTLVAAIEFVSPANKDRPENRRAFAVKCAALLQKDVSVSIVDLVTYRHFNLYIDVLDLIGQSDAKFAADPPPVYAVTGRTRKLHRRPRFATWDYPLAVGQPLPKLPIWLTEEDLVLLDLEASYEETCRFLHIP
jgi:hypothetical protein